MPRVFAPRIILYLLFLFALDMSVVPLFRIGSLRPILLYLIILYAAFQWGWSWTVPMGIMAGVLRDLTNSPILGTEALSLGLTAFIFVIVVQKLDREILFFRLLIIFSFVFLASFLNLALQAVAGSENIMTWRSVGIAIGISAYTAALTPLFFYLTARLFRDRFFLKQYELFR